MKLPLKIPAGPSKLERDFLMFWNACKGPALLREVRLVEGRKWRCDFVHPESVTVIELEGLRGRHQTIGGFIDDCDKYNALQGADPFRQVFRLTGAHVKVPYITWLVGVVNKKAEVLRGR